MAKRQSDRQEARAERREARREARADRRKGIRVAAQYVREARDEYPNATPAELREIVADQVATDFEGSPDWVSLLMQLVELLLKAWLG